jgi:serine protease Do
LVNLDGEVIGINNSIYSPTGGNLGIGFAVPSNLAKWVSDQLIANGVVRRAYIGVGMPLRSQNLAKGPGAQGQQGALVAKVFPDTPAAAAGVKPDDVIVEFAGKPVANFQELQSVVEQAAVGSRQPLVVLRDGKRTTLEVTVQEQPANYGLAQEEQLAPGQGESASNDKLGIEVSNLTEEVAKGLGVKPGEGVVITAVAAGSPAELAGLTPSMIIVQANRKLIKSVKDFKDAVAEKSPEGIQLLVRTAQGTRFVVIRAS